METTLPALYRAAESKLLSVADRLAIISEAERIFRDIHPHRPLHRQFLGVDPAAQLRAFAREVRSADYRGSVVDFHQRMISIFEKANDGHTKYMIPPPLGSSSAFLPFQVREYYDPVNEEGPQAPRIPRYIVSDVATKTIFPHPAFRMGVEIIKWNGILIREAALRQGEAGYASNEYAKHSIGLKELTYRELKNLRIPETDHVDIEFMSLNDTLSVMRLPWRFIISAKDATSLAPSTVRILFKEPESLRHVGSRRVKPLVEPVRAVKSKMVREVPVSKNVSEHFDARIVETGGSSFGIITLHNFNPTDQDEYLREMLRVVLRMPGTGLVFDARGNDGGVLGLDQKVINLFTRKRVQVSSSKMRATGLTLKLARLPVAFRDPVTRQIFDAASRTAGLRRIVRGPIFRTLPYSRGRI